MKQQQEGLSKQLEEMKKKLDDYNKGQNNSKGMGEMGQEMMQMAAKQRAIREGHFGPSVCINRRDDLRGVPV